MICGILDRAFQIKSVLLDDYSLISLIDLLFLMAPRDGTPPCPHHTGIIPFIRHLEILNHVRNLISQFIAEMDSI